MYLTRKELPQNLLNELIKGKETSMIEFKNAQGKDGKGSIPKSVYETVCAFSNHYGGNIYLGVDDDGTVIGIDMIRIEKMKKDFITVIQSRLKFIPPLFLEVEDYKVGDKVILHIYVPNSSEIHRLNERYIFDRNGDADIDITNNTNSVNRIYMRKQTEYSENKVFTEVKISDFRKDLINRMRNSSLNYKNGNPLFENLNDFDILKSLSMYKRDKLSGEMGFTLAAVLVFGDDKIIKQCVPYFAVDVLVRFKNVERWDDRLRLQTNLLDCFSQVLEFLTRYVGSPFYLERAERVDVTYMLLREVIVNMLVHREYASPYVSRIELRSNKLILNNANKPINPGLIKKNDIAPFAKNPNIATVFHTLDLIDEIGSGMRKIFKYGPILFGGEPVINNDESFQVILPINGRGLSVIGTMVIPEEKPLFTDDQINVLNHLNFPMSSNQMKEYTKYNSQQSFSKLVLRPLLKGGWISPTIKDKLSSPKQTYYRNDDMFGKL